MGRVVVIVTDEKTLEISGVCHTQRFNQGLWRNPGFFRLQHGCGAVGIVGADVDHLVTAQALKADPDIGLDVFEQMPEVDRAVGIGQGAGNEKAACHGCADRLAAEIRAKDAILPISTYNARLRASATLESPPLQPFEVAHEDRTVHRPLSG
jgi:hypothetical protein